MIKPSDLPIIPQGNPDHRDAIEAHIDEKIRQHHKARAPWPLAIQNTRAGWSSVDIGFVLEKYRQAGWMVMDGGRDVLATFDRPKTA